MRLARAWFYLFILALCSWLAVLILVMVLERVLTVVWNPLLRALLGVVLLAAWVVFMALSVELVRARLGRGNSTPQKCAGEPSSALMQYSFNTVYLYGS